MTKKNDNNSICGMRLIDPYKPFIGLVWEELSDEEAILRLYRINEYNIYDSEDIKTLPLDSLSNFADAEKAVDYLKKSARAIIESYDLYLEEGLYETIRKNCKTEAELKELVESAD